MLKRGGPTPLYHQVKTLILREIEAGRFEPGQQLPTEDSLSAHYRVSKITVREALRELARLGYIRREQGRGTFVQRPALEQGPRELTSFTDEMRRRGLIASSQVLEQGVVPASETVAAALGLSAGDPVFRLRRLRLADGEPMGVQTACIPLALVPEIETLSFDARSLYDLLADRYSLFPARAREIHMAVAVSGEHAKLLRVAVGSPAMAAERISHLADGRALEHVHSIMRGDRYKIVLDLIRHTSGL